MARNVRPEFTTVLEVTHEDRAFRVETLNEAWWVFSDVKDNKLIETNFDEPPLKQRACAFSTLLRVVRARIYGLDWVKEGVWNA